jgi:hypothetical protein
VGRAADGHFDGDPSIHVRIHTQVAIGDIARVIHELGDDDAEQAEIAFTTLDGRAGRLSQVQWVEEGVRIVLTRCPQRAEFQSRSDLSSGAKITTLTAAQLRTKLAEQA